MALGVLCERFMTYRARTSVLDLCFIIKNPGLTFYLDEVPLNV